MFLEFALTQHITEHYSDFTDPILTKLQPVLNWPQCLATQAVPLIKDEQLRGGKGLKLMVAYGGCGRTTLEILTQCENLQIDHTDINAKTLQILERLLDEGVLQWHQAVEGTLTKPMEYCLQPSLTKHNLLEGKGNKVHYHQTNYTDLEADLDEYDIVVADIRHKDSAADMEWITRRLKLGALLLLGSLDDVNINTNNNNKIDENHSLSVLRQYFTPLGEGKIEEFPHIYSETHNEYHYAVSYFSAWRKLSEPNVKNRNDVVIQKETASLTTAEYYEDKSILSSYVRFHYGPGLLGVRNFPLRMSEVCLEMCEKYGVAMGSALEAACGPGRTSFELAKHFCTVEGYDYSQSFVNMVKKKKNDDKVKNLKVYRGDSHKQEEITYCKQYDLILGSNLIDRLHTPQDWILQSKSMLMETGIFIITSPYTWMSEHTDPSKYLGGFMKDGEPFTTVDALSQLLQPHLELYEELRVPYVIPDADGTFQYAYSNCTVFGKPRTYS